MIRAMDIGIEQLYKAAQEITDRETIIIFTSDNGAAERYRPWGEIINTGGDKSYSSTGCNYPLKGRKSTLNEPGFSQFKNSILSQ